MSSAFVLVGLIIYNICLFFVSDVWVLAVLAAVETLGTLLAARRDWRGWRSFLLANSGFVGFVVLCNLVFLDTEQALIIGVRLWLAIGSTYIVSQMLSAKEFAQGIAWFCAPLRAFGVDTQELTLSIIIALTLIPLLAREAQALQDGLRLKGCKIGLKNYARHPQIYVSGIIEQLFCYVENLEQAMRLKGYD